MVASVRDENTLFRELTPFQKINDHYEKIILTLADDRRRTIMGFGE